MATSNILELADIISTNIKLLHDYLSTNNLPSPSFNADYPIHLPLPPTILASQQAILNAASDLRWHMLGPIRLLQNIASVSFYSHNSLAK
jgi:hypothetical protein